MKPAKGEVKEDDDDGGDDDEKLQKWKYKDFYQATYFMITWISKKIRKAQLLLKPPEQLPDIIHLRDYTITTNGTTEEAMECELSPWSEKGKIVDRYY